MNRTVLAHAQWPIVVPTAGGCPISSFAAAIHKDGILCAGKVAKEDKVSVIPSSWVAQPNPLPFELSVGRAMLLAKKYDAVPFCEIYLCIVFLHKKKIFHRRN